MKLPKSFRDKLCALFTYPENLREAHPTFIDRFLSDSVATLDAGTKKIFRKGNNDQIVAEAKRLMAIGDLWTELRKIENQAKKRKKVRARRQ
jgi:hypothetical protein